MWVHVCALWRLLADADACCALGLSPTALEQEFQLAMTVGLNEVALAGVAMSVNTLRREQRNFDLYERRVVEEVRDQHAGGM